MNFFSLAEEFVNKDLNILDMLNSYDIVKKLVHKNDLIFATMIDDYDDIKYYNLFDKIHENNRFFMLMKYKYINNIKDSIILQFYSVYIQDNTIHIMLLHEQMFIYDYNDDTDYTKYYNYIDEYYFGEKFINENNVLYKHLNKNNVFDIIFINDSESNKYVYIQRYLFNPQTQSLENVYLYDFEEDVNYKYYNNIVTDLQFLNKKNFHILSMKVDDNHNIHTYIIDTLTGELNNLKSKII